MEEQEQRDPNGWIRDEADGSAKEGREGNLVVAVPAGVEENLLLPVLLGVQDVVAAMPWPSQETERRCRQ